MGSLSFFSIPRARDRLCSLQICPITTMTTPHSLLDLTLPLGRQRVELHPIQFDAGGMPMLRVRIAEGKRFTIFDVDPISAAAWGEAMQAWSQRVLASEA